MNEVGVRLKVAASGLENIQALTKDLSAAGVETAALDRKAAELAAELKRLGAEQALIDSFKRQKTAVAEAGTAMTAAKLSAGDLARALAATEAPSAAQQAAFARSRTAAREADAAYQAQRLALQQLRAQMAAAGLATDGLAAAQVRNNQSTAAARAEIARLEAEYRQAAQAATQSAGTQVRASEQVKSGLQDVGRQIALVRNLAQAAIGGQLLGGLIGDVTKTADAYNNLAARIKLVTGEGEPFKAAFEGVFDVATRTNSSLEATGTLFARIAQAGKDIGVSQQDALRLTETVNQAVQLSGASAEASNAAITQLIQGLQSGVLRGDEFNSVMEQAPRLAQALAAGLGVTTGELRKMAEAGALSAQTVIGALQGQGATLRKEFDQLPATVGRAVENLSTNWQRYVGEVDKANGVSAAAARVIEALARNLDGIGAALLEAGKAFAGYTALRIAETFNDKARAALAAAEAMRQETAATHANTAAQGANATGKARNAAAWVEMGAAIKGETAALGADSAALGVNTGATAANAGAKRASAAATAGAAAGLAGVGAAASASATGLNASAAAAGATVGRFAAMRAAGVALVSTLGYIGAALAATALAWDALKAAGTWIGESAAKLAGYRDRTDELARSTKAAAAETRAAAEEQAGYAQRLALAADKALGLNNISRKLVGDFDDLRTKGAAAGEALQKLAKDLDLGSPKGINDAVTALDALERKGKITGEQVRLALAQALDGKDLGIFETQARAAFDGTEQGVRRLQAALDAVAGESLKRVGTSAQELETGFSAALNSAMNDTDALAKTLAGLGVKGEEAGRLLGKSLNQELEAAATERAIARVQQRLVELRAQGKLTADQFAAGMQTATQKADELREGINSVAEAARQLGIKTSVDLRKTAADFKESWDRIRDSTEIGLREKIAAFARYREAAIAANGGVESSEVALQRETLRVRAEVAGLGDQFTSAMGKANTAVAGTKQLVNELGEEVNAAGERINQMAAGFGAVASAADKAAASARGASDQRLIGTYDAGAIGNLQSKERAGTLSNGDDRIAQAALEAALYNLQQLQNAGRTNPNAISRDAYASVQRQISEAERLRAVIANLPGAAGGDSGSSSGSASSSHRVEIVLGGRTASINAASSADAQNLVAFLKQLEAAQARVGG